MDDIVYKPTYSIVCSKDKGGLIVALKSPRLKSLQLRKIIRQIVYVLLQSFINTGISDSNLQSYAFCCSQKNIVMICCSCIETKWIELKPSNKRKLQSLPFHQLAQWLTRQASLIRLIFICTLAVFQRLVFDRSSLIRTELKNFTLKCCLGQCD